MDNSTRIIYVKDLPGRLSPLIVSLKQVIMSNERTFAARAGRGSTFRMRLPVNRPESDETFA